MTDIVERLRRDAARFSAMDAAGDQPWVADAAWTADAFHAAVAEIEWLRGERNRLAADLAKAHREALAWMQKANQPEGEVEQLRDALSLGIHMREAQTTYFKTRSRDALIAAKALEKEFLDRARALLTEGGR